MTFYVDLIPAAWHWFCWPVLIFSLIYSLWSFPLRSVLAVPLRQHLILGSAIALLLTWKIAANLKGLDFELHLFGITAVVMLIGSSPALIAGALALVLQTLISPTIGWTAFAVNFVIGILLPVVISAACLGLIARLPQKNLFAYMLGAGFAGAIATRLVTTLLIYLLWHNSGDISLADTADAYLPWMLLISFPEGFVNGMVITAITVYLPHWMRSFDEQRYMGK